MTTSRQMFGTEALLCAERGWHVFPCSPRDKRPLTEHGVDDATLDRTIISEWWERWPNAMIGVRTGRESGFFAVDLDADQEKGLDGIAAFEALKNGGELPETITTQTPRGGRHLFFRYVDGIKNRVGAQRKNDNLPRGVDVRGQDGYVIVPPSRRADGAAYQFLIDDRDGPAQAPQWLLDLLITKENKSKSKANGSTDDTYARAALERECAAVTSAQPGTRNHALNTAAFNLGQLVAGGALSESELRDRLYNAAVACGLVKDDGHNAVEKTIASGLGAGSEKPRGAPERRNKQVETAAPAPAIGDLKPCTIKETLDTFKRWLILRDQTPVLAVLGTVAANLLPGDPVWLGVIAPPSSAKTEILNSTSALPWVVQAATVTPAGLLSGTPKKQYDKAARGGLLRQIGEFGIICLKDFGSVLNMHTETRAEVLAALREIYDGHWTRHLGTDGGRTLNWNGKVGIIFAATEVIDSHYAVIGAMGDRFLLSRLVPTPGRQQFTRALDHVGATTKQMRQELTEAVARLFAGRRAEPNPISKDEIEAIGAAISLAVRLRGAVARDFRSREIEAIYGAEGTARIGLALERLLAGLDTLGVERKTALQVVRRVALDSVPPLRRRAYDCVRRYRDVETTDVAVELGLPTVTTRRILEELAAHGLISRTSQGQGKADKWNPTDWEADEARQEPSPKSHL